MESKEVFDAINANHSAAMDQQAAAAAKQAEDAAKAKREAQDKRLKIEARKAEAREAAEKRRRTHLILSVASSTVSAAAFVALVAILWWIQTIPANVAPWIIFVPVTAWAFSLGYKLNDLGV